MESGMCATVGVDSMRPLRLYILDAPAWKDYNRSAVTLLPQSRAQKPYEED